MTTNDELTQEVQQSLQILRYRPGMLIPVLNPSYQLVAAYLGGYLNGIGITTGRKLYHNIHCWLCEQRKEAVSAVWEFYILHKHPTASDKGLTNLLLDDIESYFKQNPNWQKEDLTYRWWLWLDEDTEAQG